MAAGSFYGTFLVLTLGCHFSVSAPEDRRRVSEAGAKVSRGVFAPRMYYDEWTPLGHGDPLKNDPTYDYVPPLLEHVHYWEEPHRPSEPSLNARKDSPDLDTKPEGFPALPQVPPTMLVPPPLPSMELSTRPPPTTLVDIEPLKMVHHSSTTGNLVTKPDSPLPWRPPNTLMQLTTAPTMQYETKERPFSRNNLYQQSPPVLKPQPLPPKIKPSSIPIQQGQPFRLPQATKAPILGKPIKKVEEKESLASLLQSLLDDIPTTTETSVRYTPTTPPYIATTTTTTPAPVTTTEHIFSPAVPVTAPLYLIIQGHSKVKTYGASKAPSIHDIPHNQLVGDLKVRFP